MFRQEIKVKLSYRLQAAAGWGKDVPAARWSGEAWAKRWDRDEAAAAAELPAYADLSSSEEKELHGFLERGPFGPGLSAAQAAVETYLNDVDTFRSTGGSR